jgi:hypothetical protein
MTTNLYFSQGRSSEQELYEDLIIESLKIYGQDVYYMPREIVNKDSIFQDDNVSRFDDAYKIEMYIENTEGFDGEGDLFTKFGVEIRDAATFIVSRRRWLNQVAVYESSENKPFYRPREGDLISLPLSNSIFEITRVEDESPFYQLKDLPVFKIRAELFEYNDEDFDTGVESVDNVEGAHAYQTILTFSSTSGDFVFNENVSQTIGDYTITGEVVNINNSDPESKKIYVAHTGGAGDGEYHGWTTTAPVVGATSGANGTPISVGEDLQDGAMNDSFNTTLEGGDIDFIDFSESNPFGDP